MNKFKELLIESLDLTFYGNNLIYLFFLFILILVSILFNSLIANLIVNKIKIVKTSNQIDDELFKTYYRLRILPIVLFFFYNIKFLIKLNIGFYLIKINNTLATIFIFWFTYCLLTPFSYLFIRLEKPYLKHLFLG